MSFSLNAIRTSQISARRLPLNSATIPFTLSSSSLQNSSASSFRILSQISQLPFAPHTRAFSSAPAAVPSPASSNSSLTNPAGLRGLIQRAGWKKVAAVSFLSVAIVDLELYLTGTWPFAANEDKGKGKVQVQEAEQKGN